MLRKSGTATGIGSYPGDDPLEALHVAFEMPLPYLPELPARGPGADMIGRTAGMLVDLPVEIHPSGWRLAGAPGRDVRRSRDLLGRDLDALEEVAQGYDGDLKISATGPWTLAASIELASGERILRDAGAVRDLCGSLAEGLAAHIGDVRRRVPGATVILQLDEPGLPGVLAGRVPTASGLGRLPAVDAPVAEEALGRLIAGVGDIEVVVHCCAARVPFALIRTAGAKGISFDLAQPIDEDALAESIDAGMAVFWGVLPSVDGPLPPASDAVDPVRRLWRKLGFAAGDLPEMSAVTPRCGLAGASSERARAILERCTDAAKALADSPA